jgi:hypothetical protein
MGYFKTRHVMTIVPYDGWGGGSGTDVSGLFCAGYYIRRGHVKIFFSFQGSASIQKF